MLHNFWPEETYLFLMTFVRVGTMIMLFPSIGQAWVPTRIRLLLALMVTALIYRLLAPYLYPARETLDHVMLLVFSEFVIGLLIGTSFRFALGAMNYAGAMVAYGIGLSNAQLLNPLQNAQSLLPSLFITMVGTTLIFATNLHHFLFLAIRHSYDAFPPYQFPNTGDMASFIARSAAKSFEIGLQMSAPFVIGSIAFYWILGIMAKIAPQVQVFFVALPLQVILGFYLLIGTLGIMLGVFLGYYEEVVEFFLPI